MKMRYKGVSNHTLCYDILTLEVGHTLLKYCGMYLIRGDVR